VLYAVTSSLNLGEHHIGGVIAVILDPMAAPNAVSQGMHHGSGATLAETDATIANTSSIELRL
jgi:hypothetical protein